MMKTFNTMHWPDAVGLLGVLITLLAYFLLNLRKVDPRRWVYPALNVVGSLLIMVSLLFAWNLSAWVMEAAWLAVSLYGLYQALYTNRK